MFGDNGDCYGGNRKRALHMGRTAHGRIPPIQERAVRARRRMTRVYTDVCQTLGLSDSDHHETNVVAEKVIEFAQRRARDPMLLRDCVLGALRG